MLKIKSCLRGALGFLFVVTTQITLQANVPGAGLVDASTLDLDALPRTADDLKVDFYIKEPHIINPGALCFDKMGRLFVGAGPQYRGPQPDSPKDYIKLLIDRDHDGVVDEVKTFAKGFNSIQGMAWRDGELWVANAPDMTVLVDHDGDDVADEYRLVFTGLNTLRHGLHGLNWGPDGKLYMSYGNTRSGDHAPKVIRDLQGYKSDHPDNQPLNTVFTPDTYQKSYRTMKKNETEGGILRCDRRGENLEIYSRGLRNPWDITFDSGFNWLGTDNDPGPQHDRIFMPMQYAHYTYRHPWIFDWMARSEAIAPVVTKFEGVSGSGTGVIYNISDHFGEKYKNKYFVADWTNNCIFLYKPKWDGAHQVLDGQMTKFIDGGTNKVGDLKYKGGKGVSIFRPTDIEIGPTGELYIAGWGSSYGTEYKPESEWTEEDHAKYQGRIFKLSSNKNDPIPASEWLTSKRNNDFSKWNFDELMEDLGHQLPVWRTNAQDELVRRGLAVRAQLIERLSSGSLNESQATWTFWTIVQIDENAKTFEHALSEASKNTSGSLNLQIQAVRALGLYKVKEAIPALASLLQHKEPRIRHAAITALGETGFGSHEGDIIEGLSLEEDRVTSYTGFQVLRRSISIEKLRQLLKNSKPVIRKMAMLGLMETDSIKAEEVFRMKKDNSVAVKTIAHEWLVQKRLILNDSVNLVTEDSLFRDDTKVSMSYKKGFTIHYTLDGSEPKETSPIYEAPLKIEKDTVVKAHAFMEGSAATKLASMDFRKISDSEWKDRLIVHKVKVDKGNFKVIHEGLQKGSHAFLTAKQKSTLVNLPEFLAGATQVLSEEKDNNKLAFKVNIPAQIYVGYPVKAKTPSWLTKGFQQLDDEVKTSRDVRYKLYKSEVDEGVVKLGDKKGESFLVFASKDISGKTSVSSSMDVVGQANHARGKEIFFGRGTCFACHAVDGKGIAIGPDLNGISKRRDLKYVVQSIVRPDDYIVEGYQQTHVKLRDGSEYFGMMQESTANSLTIVTATGEKIVVDTKNIRNKQDVSVSGMPSSFAYTLKPQDVADISAWLMTLGSK